MNCVQVIDRRHYLFMRHDNPHTPPQIYENKIKSVKLINPLLLVGF